MNERSAKLYDQALVIESNGDYVAGELDPAKFAELIVEECAGVELYWLSEQDRKAVAEKIKEHFGVE